MCKTQTIGEQKRISEIQRQSPEGAEHNINPYIIEMRRIDAQSEVPNLGGEGNRLGKPTELRKRGDWGGSQWAPWLRESSHAGQVSLTKRPVSAGVSAFHRQNHEAVQHKPLRHTVPHSLSDGCC